MSKLVKAFAVVAVIAGAMAALPGTAEAQWHGGHGGWHGGWHGGGWGWGPGFGLGLGLGYGVGYPYYYGGGPYYGPGYYGGPGCGYRRIRVWAGDHWALRRVWRCY